MTQPNPTAVWTITCPGSLARCTAASGSCCAVVVGCAACAAAACWAAAAAAARLCCGCCAAGSSSWPRACLFTRVNLGRSTDRRLAGGRAGAAVGPRRDAAEEAAVARSGRRRRRRRSRARASTASAVDRQSLDSGRHGSAARAIRAGASLRRPTRCISRSLGLRRIARRELEGGELGEEGKRKRHGGAETAAENGTYYAHGGPCA